MCISTCCIISVSTQEKHGIIRLKYYEIIIILVPIIHVYIKSYYGTNTMCISTCCILLSTQEEQGGSTCTCRLKYHDHFCSVNLHKTLIRYVWHAEQRVHKSINPFAELMVTSVKSLKMLFAHFFDTAKGN